MDLADGEPCVSAEVYSAPQCQAGSYCFSGKCAPKVGVGDACTWSEECAVSGVACSFFNHGNQSCCPTEHWQTYNAQGYCTKLSNGMTCAQNWQCNSGNCWANTCAASLPTGTNCGNARQCESKACAFFEAWKQTKCCPSETDWTSYWSHGYCKGLSAGSSCSYDWQCDGMCVSNVCVSGKKTGVGCSSSDECAGDVACELFDWNDNKPACCPTGTWQNWWAHGYCKNIGKGDKCAHWWQCSSYHSNSCSNGVCT